MFHPPQAAAEVFGKFAPVFRARSFVRMQWLVMGAILVHGRRTFTHILVMLSGLVSGHFATFYRLFSRSPWSCWKAGKILASLVIEAAPSDEPIVVLVDTTVSEHPGRHVYGKGKHRDAVRSSHSYTAWRWGHKRVVLACAIVIPFVRRRWALPVLMALYLPKEVNEQQGRRHKTSADLAMQLMRVLLGWFPDRKFIFVGDGDFSTQSMARFARKHRKRLTFVGRFYQDAALYEPPPKYSGAGRPRVKGQKMPNPAEVVCERKPWKTSVSWYGGSRRKVGLISGTGHWYKAGLGLVEIRWVQVEDRQGTHRTDFFFSTDPTTNMKQIVEYYTMRWSIETTFQEVRAHLGFESTRHRVQKSVERVEPWLLALFSIVSLIYIRHLKSHKPRLPHLPWWDKQEPTFADALTVVRRLIWVESIFSNPTYNWGVEKLTPKIREKLLGYLTAAA